MAQDNVFGHLLPTATPQPAQNNDPIIKRGGPDPYQVQKDNVSQANETERLDLSRASNAREAAKFGQETALKPLEMASKLRDDFTKIQAVKDYSVALPILMSALKASPNATGDNALIYAYAKIMDPGSVVRESEMGMAASGASVVDSTVANLKKQFGIDGGGQLPSKVRERLKQEMNSRTSQYAKAYGSSRRDYQEMAKRYGLNPDDIVGTPPAAPFLQEYDRLTNLPEERVNNRPSNDALVPSGTANAINDQQGAAPRFTPEQEKQLVALAPRAKGPQDLMDLASTFDIPITPESAQRVFDYYQKGGTAAPAINYSGSDKAYQDQLAAEIKARGGNQTGAGDLLVQGGTFGLSDEAVGGVSAIVRGLSGDGQGYGFERDLYRRNLDQTREQLGSLGTALEFGGALMTGKPGATMDIAPTLAGKVKQSAKIGALGGGAAGFGYGEGTQNSLLGSLAGGAAGATIGGALPLAGKGVNALLGKLPTRTATSSSLVADGVAAGDVAAAGQAEGIVIPRALVDPTSRNKAAGVGKTMVGGPKLQQGLDDVRQSIKAGVDNLSGGTAFSEPAAAGQSIADISKRFIKSSGTAIGRVYDRAVQMAQGVEIQPAQAAQAVDDAIARLSKTQNTNSAEIAYLQGLKADLSKPLDVEALRGLRTTLRKKISKGDLIFGENEARVKGIMDTLSQDIATGLTQAGKGEAAQLFTRADGLYRQRMEFIDGTIQKLIGKRNASFPPETIIRNFRGMASKDTSGLANMMRSMTPEERADIGATFAESLGKLKDGNFSAAEFVKNVADIPPTARTALFGPQGAESLKNLQTIAKALKAVPQGGSPTGQSNNYGSWLGTAFLSLFSSGAGYAGGSTMTGAAVGATLLAGKAGREYVDARLLLSPKITKWVATAPRTTNPKVIDAHFKRLSAIAAQEPALAGDIQIISQRIMDAAKNGLAGPSAGQDVGEAGKAPPQEQ